MLLNDFNYIGKHKGLYVENGSSIVPPGPFEFGLATEGVLTDIYDSSQYLCCRFLCPQDGNIYKMSANIFAPFHTGLQNMEMSVFSDAAGLLGSILVNGAGQFDENQNWRDINLALPVAAGTYYYLCIWGEVHFSVPYNNGAVAQSTRKYFQTYPNWISPNTPVDQAIEDFEYSILAYCNP